MRKIDWDRPLSDEDKLWLSTTGILGIEDRIKANEEQFTTSVEDEGDEDNNEVQDDYDTWTVPQLKEEVESRKPHPNVTGTGAGGKPIAADYIRALRSWDVEHPED
jgi:hypothetical protein